MTDTSGMAGERSSATLALHGAADTIAAIATAPGRGALAMVRISGPSVDRIATRILDAWPLESRHATLIRVRHPETGSTVDHAVATFYRAPASYTGEDVLELSVHGGAAVPVLIMDALLTAGAREALPGEFTRRAVLNGKMDLVQAEAVGDLVAARSRAMHGAALSQLDGSLSRRLQELRESVLDLEALVAYEIDFPEEDEGPIAEDRVESATSRLVSELDALLATGPSGELVREGAVVVIAGPPNAGKSSLFNALLGQQRAIVTEVPGTTRDALEALVDMGPWPVRLVDTAGLRETTEVVERLGIEVSERWLERADVVLACADSVSGLVEVTGKVGALTSAPVVGVRTKSDTDLYPDRYERASLERAENYSPVDQQGAIGELNTNNDEIDGGTSVAAVSAHSGAGLTNLIAAVEQVLSSRHVLPAPDAPLLMRERHRRAVALAREEVDAFASARQRGIPAAIGAVHLRSAAAALEDLIGAVDVEDVLGRVFSSFCVGK